MLIEWVEYFTLPILVMAVIRKRGKKYIKSAQVSIFISIFFLVVRR